MLWISVEPIEIRLLKSQLLVIFRIYINLAQICACKTSSRHWKQSLVGERSYVIFGRRQWNWYLRAVTHFMWNATSKTPVHTLYLCLHNWYILIFTYKQLILSLTINNSYALIASIGCKKITHYCPPLHPICHSRHACRFLVIYISISIQVLLIHIHKNRKRGSQ